MDSINKRLKELRLHLRLSTVQFGKKIGYSDPMISQLENGKKPFTDKFIFSVCRAFNVSETWLRDGAGPMFGASDSTDNDLSGIASERDNAVKAFFYGMFSKLDPAEKKTILNALLDSMKE